MEQPIPRMVRFVLILYRFDFRRDKVIDRAGKDNVYFSDERAPSYTKQGNLSLFQPLPPSFLTLSPYLSFLPLPHSNSTPQGDLWLQPPA